MPAACKVVVTFGLAAIVTAASAAPPVVKPDALLAIDQNRATVVNRVVETWAEPLGDRRPVSRPKSCARYSPRCGPII